MNSLSRPLVALLSGLIATAAAAPAASAQSKRHTTVIDETIDGKAASESAADNAIFEALLGAGIVFIDAEQSQQIRSVTDAGTLMAGTVPAVVSTLDADVIIAGTCTVEKFETRLADARLKRYDATLRLRVIAVDTGQIVGAFTGQGQGMGFSQAQAVTDAAQGAVKKLLPKLLPALRAHDAAGGRIELSVSGVPNVSIGRQLLDAVRTLDGVSKATTRHGGRGITEIEIMSDGVAAADLAVALDGVSGLGVQVFGFSDRAIKAEYLPQAALNLTLVPTPFVDKRRARADAWKAKTLSGVIAVSLSNEAFVSLPDDDRVTRLGAPKGWRKALTKLGHDPASTMVLSGSYTREGGGVQVQAQVRAAASGKTVLTGQRSCQADALAACAGELGDSLAEQLLANVVEKRRLFKSLPSGGALAAAAPAVRPLRIRSVAIDNIYPARLNAYADQPVGQVVVENTSDTELTQIRVTTHVAGFMATALDTTVSDLPPGETATLPLAIVLQRDALLQHDENLPAVLSFQVQYRQDDFTLSEERSRALVVYDRNTLSWAEPASVASFITPRTAAVQALAAQVARVRTDEQANHRLARPAAVFSTLGALGLRYELDPVNPYGKEALDYVQFPEQTLARKRGDCDDLAVIYAAVAEALGMRVLLVTTPEHVFVAVHTGVPSHNEAVLSVEPGRLIAHDGTLWLPLETTLTRGTVSQAWAAAVDELARWKGEPDKVQLIDVRDAWKRFPPTSLMPSSDAHAAIDIARLGQDVAATVAALDKDRAKALAKALAAHAGDGPEARLARARLLALNGDLDGAQAELAGIGPEAPVRTQALNNAGNIQLARDQGDAAYKAYLEAAGRDAKDARIQINAAVAAHSLGREDAFAEHVFNAMDLGATDLVEALAQTSIGRVGTRGADRAGKTSRNLAEAVRKALKKRGRTLPEAGQDGVRASDAAAGPVSLTEHVHWL